MSDDLYPNELLRLIGRVIGLINMENCLLCLIWGTKINPWNGPWELLSSYQHFLHALIISRLSFVIIYLIYWHFWREKMSIKIPTSHKIIAVLCAAWICTTQIAIAASGYSHHVASATAKKKNKKIGNMKQNISML